MMAKKSKKRVKRSRDKRLDKVINSYLLAHRDDPYTRLKLLQKFLKVKKIASVDLKTLRDMVKGQITSLKNQEKLDKLEAVLFTKDGKVKDNRYGSAFCKNCRMFKNYEKECPYCGSLEMS